MLDKTLESPLDSKEIQPVNPKGNQPWIFIGRTAAEAEAPILWPPDVKSWLIGKDTDAGKDWRREEKGPTEDEVVGWHHRIDGHEFEQTLGDSRGQGSPACCSPWARRVGHDWATEQQQEHGELGMSYSLPRPESVPPGTKSGSWLLSVEFPNEQSSQPTPSLPLQSRAQWDPMGKSCKRKPAARHRERGTKEGFVFWWEAGSCWASPTPVLPLRKPEWFQNISQAVDNRGSLVKKALRVEGERRIRVPWWQQQATPAKLEPPLLHPIAGWSMPFLLKSLHYL